LPLIGNFPLQGKFQGAISGSSEPLLPLPIRENNRSRCKREALAARLLFLPVFRRMFPEENLFAAKIKQKNIRPIKPIALALPPTPKSDRWHITSLSKTSKI
jgi:hypothetical protein